MQFIKRHFKFIIGIAALIIAIIIFFMAQRSESLESGNLKSWLAASDDRRIAAVRILRGADEHTELIKMCIDKIASLPDSGEMSIRDAESLCYTGIQLKDNI